MIDHVALAVSDYARSRDFYREILAPFGYGLLMEFGGATAGFGRDGKPDFWIHPGSPGDPVHLAFAAEDRATVDRFHRTALEAGARDNGAPGLRPQYHPTYYGAFVLDPDGHNVEAVCHRPE